MQRQSLHFPAESSQLGSIRAAAGEFIGSSISDKEKNRLILALDEATANIIIHGYAGSPGEIILTMEKSAECITIIFDDTAPLYNPLEQSPADIDRYYREGKSGGLGVDAYTRIADVRWEKNPLGGNRLIFTKKVSS